MDVSLSGPNKVEAVSERLRPAELIHSARRRSHPSCGRQTEGWTGEREEEALEAGKRIEMSEQKGRLGQVGQGWVGRDREKKKQQDNGELDRGAGDEERRAALP